MRKLFYVTLAALLVCGVATAQNEEPKKKGGFMKALKKGVESTTGLRVSDETLFVYPEEAAIGEWKVELVSCVGNPATGEVQPIIKVTKFGEDGAKNTWCKAKEAVVTGSKESLALERRSADPLYSFLANTPVEVTLERVGGVPADARTLDIKFYIWGKEIMFEGRRMPIEWQTAE